MFRSSEGARLSAERAMAMSAGGEADVFGLGGVDIVILEGSMTGLSEMTGILRPSVVV